MKHTFYATFALVVLIIGSAGVVNFIGKSATATFSNVSDTLEPPPPPDNPKKTEPARLVRNDQLPPEEMAITVANAHWYDPVFWLLLVGGAFIGAWAGYWIKWFKDLAFRKEMNERKMYVRGAFIMTSFIISFGATGTIVIEYWTPPFYNRVLATSVFTAIIADVLMSILASEWLRSRVTTLVTAKLPNPPEEAKA